MSCLHADLSATRFITPGFIQSIFGRHRFHFIGIFRLRVINRTLHVKSELRSASSAPTFTSVPERRKQRLYLQRSIPSPVVLSSLQANSYTSSSRRDANRPSPAFHVQAGYLESVRRIGSLEIPLEEVETLQSQLPMVALTFDSFPFHATAQDHGPHPSSPSTW